MDGMLAAYGVAIVTLAGAVAVLWRRSVVAHQRCERRSDRLEGMLFAALMGDKDRLAELLKQSREQPGD